MRLFKKKQSISRLDVPSYKINTLEQQKRDKRSSTLKKSDEIIYIDDDYFLIRRRSISDQLRKALDAATLYFIVTDAYMHYMKEELDENMDAFELNHQTVFFWEATEVFKRKSLPPHYETFSERYFRVIAEDDEVGIAYGEVAPWFGQTGGGMKYYFTHGDDMIPLADAERAGIIEYFQFVELNEENNEFLTDRKHNYFLTNGRSLDFIDGFPAIGKKQISISLAYECGLFDIVSK
jgi:hypothetical protein